MGLFLSITGFLMVPFAIAWLVFSFFKGKKKLIPSLSIVAGILICLTGLMIVGANVTPEELAKIEENKKAREKAKGEKLEVARLEEKKEAEKLEKQKMKEEESAKQKELAEEENKKEDELKIQQQVEQKKKVELQNDEAETEGKEEVFLDIKRISNKNEKEINDILGPISESELNNMIFNGMATPYKVNYYNDGKIEVMFIDDTSKNIRVKLDEEEYFDDINIQKNLQYISLPIKDLKVVTSADGYYFAHSYDFDDIYKIEISRWRNQSGGSIFVILDERYKY